jgi:hypothetical protein
MVAKITVPITIKRALNYNEQKVQKGMAECIYAKGFLKEAGQLNFYEKLNHFERLISLNKRAATNTVHVSLNFALNEKISKEKLTEIASVYMEKIGFGKQPYLVYQHLDAGHAHIHIVTTNIQSNGKRISLHNLGRNESTQARKEIEIAFKLVKAEDQKKQQSEEVKPLEVQRLTYGKSPTKRGITNVLDAVLPKYKYASLAELNAVLKLYNLVADRGKEDGIIFKKRGLVYRILDKKGNKIGVPVKASSIYNKPTLSYLEIKFKENEIGKQEYKKSLKISIDWIMVKPPKNLQAFKTALEKEKINLVIRQNNDGIVYGLTYIDHKTKCVFNGSDMGKEYSAKSILAKCGIAQLIPNQEKSPESKISTKEGKETTHNLDRHPELKQDLSKALEVILSPEEANNYVPYELRKQKKKKRKSH